MNVEPLTPITSVKVIRSIPFDNTYKDVLDFSSTSSQISYFTGKAKETFTNLSPVSIYKNSIKLPRPADFFYDCNYLMFQNANFNTKWFYAFITNIEYVSVNMSIVHFEIDVFQTWYFDVTIKESLVEREHSTTDNVGDNLVIENVDLGYYREEPAERTNMMNGYYTVVATSWLGDETVSGGLKGGIYSGLKYIAYDTDNSSQVSELNEFLKLITQANKIDSVVSLFMIPSSFYRDEDLPAMLRFEATMNKSKIGNYTPKNKKLLTYPYNFLYVHSSDGSNAIYKYEYFQSNTVCAFALSCGMSCNPEIVLEPIAYQSQQFNVDESLVLSGFPQCSYTIDSFRAYLAQNSTSLGLNLISNGVTAVTNPVAGTLGMASTLNGVVQASMKPPMARGSQGNSTFVGTREKDFYFINKHISEEYAKIIDDYFSMFGYATNRVKIPNTKNRPSWNYVKTQDIKIVGSVPFNDMAKIKTIYNNGVTIWHGDWVGDYSRNNQV